MIIHEEDLDNKWKTKELKEKLKKHTKKPITLTFPLYFCYSHFENSKVQLHSILLNKQRQPKKNVLQYVTEFWYFSNPTMPIKCI